MVSQNLLERQKKFIDQIRNCYIEARKIKYSSSVNKVIRGTSHSISAIAEDLFAAYCADLLPSNNRLTILVDPQISFSKEGLRNRSGKRPLLIRPDVCFLEDNVITKIFDLKTDLGYKRKEVIEQLLGFKDVIERIKGKGCVIKIDNGNVDTKVSQNLRSAIIILSGGKNSGDVDDTQTRLREECDIDAFVLTKSKHLNTYDTSPQFVITKDFTLLDEFITN